MSAQPPISGWVANKWQKSIFHSFEGQKVQDQSTCRFSGWWRPSSRHIDGTFLPCPDSVGEVRELSGVSFIMSWIPFMWAPPLGLNHFQKASPPNTITLRVIISIWTWGGGAETFSLLQIELTDGQSRHTNVSWRKKEMMWNWKWVVCWGRK